MTRVCGRLLLMKCIFASAVIASAVIVDDQIVPEEEFTDIVAADPMAHPTEDALPRSTVVAPVPEEEFTDTVPVDSTPTPPSEDSDKPKPSSRPREEDLPAELISAESTSCSMKVCGCNCHISISASECATVKATSQSSLKEICWDTPHDDCVDLSDAIPGVQMTCVGAGDETAWSTADLTSWTTPLLKVTSGTACVIDSNDCVTDGSGSYGNNERCTITAQADIKVTAKKLVTEDGYDYIEIAGHKYSGYNGLHGGALKDVRMAKGATMKWASDGSVGMDGFVICPTRVSSELVQVSSQSAVQEDASVEQEEDDTQEEVSPAHSDRIGPNLFDWGGEETDLVQLSKVSKGKHDAQYVWASKAIAKSVLHASTCKPSTNGKEAPKMISCGRRLLSTDEYQKHAMSNTTASRQLLGSCGCGSWTTAGPLCVQPCSEQGSHSHDTGLYCSQPCNREGQVALREGCGVGHDRVCVKDAGACVRRHVDRTVAFMEMVMSIITLGGGAMAARNARTQAQKAAKGGLTRQHSLRRLGTELMGSAKSLAARAKTEPSGFIQQQLRKEKNGATQDRILENGALLLLTANLPTNWGAVAWEIGAAVDPTGIVGFAKGFVPPSSSCNDEVYFKTEMPKQNKDGLDYDALDLVPGRWGDADLPHIPDVEFSLIAQGSECQGGSSQELNLGSQTSLKACANACTQHATCKHYGTFTYGWGLKRNRCWAEFKDHGNKCLPQRNSYNTYVLGLYSKVHHRRECRNPRAEHLMATGLNVDQCVTRCLNDETCKKYRTISLGIGAVKAGRCFSEHMKYTNPEGKISRGSGYCRSWMRSDYDSYQIGSPYKIKSIRDFDILEKDVSCRNIHASTEWNLHSTGKMPQWSLWGPGTVDLGLTATNTACFQKLQAKGYQLGQWSQSHSAGKDHKHFCGKRACTGIEAKSVHEMFGWLTDSSKWQQMVPMAVAVYYQKACPSMHYWTFTQHCPPSSPYRSPKNTRCYEFKWGGKMCNVDPKGDVPANRQDTPCECETRCDTTYGSQNCPLAMPIRYPNNNRCFEYKWGGKACNVDPKNDPVGHQRGDTVVCNCAPTSETGVLPK